MDGRVSEHNLYTNRTQRKKDTKGSSSLTRVKRTEQIWIKPNNKLSTLCHYAKNLFNEANYLIRLNLFDTGQWLRYGEYYHQVKRSSNYNHLPTQTAQQLLRQLDRNWKAFFEAMKEWKKHPEKFHGTPRPPKY
jgi:transposase